MCINILCLGVSVACVVEIDVGDKILTRGIALSQHDSPLGGGAGTCGRCLDGVGVIPGGASLGGWRPPLLHLLWFLSLLLCNVA